MLPGGEPPQAADRWSMVSGAPDLVSPDTVGTYFARRGLVPDGATVTAAELPGGVSNLVLAVDAPGVRAVLKQSLPRLRVDGEWLAKRERVLTEAEALRLAGRLEPGTVPDVLDVDEDALAIVIERAPDGWHNWKHALLGGDADPAVAERLGRLLAAWHRETDGDEEVARQFADVEAFGQLRVDPYYGPVMGRWPQLRRPVGAHVEAMLRNRTSFVHGDFSPKNVLVGGNDIWVVDFEVAHVGDPAFDVAFMLNHLMLKALHRPAGADCYRACALGFWSAYCSAIRPATAPEATYLVGHIGCLMLARVDGKSPAEYLTEPQRLVARSFGSRMVLQPMESVETAWADLQDVLEP